ncbi:hypothetical protein AQUCO_04900089v1 [Aquilegia coerulea]|uniref:Uncharacterized protein n=1 Tax=Aquilegia coerulea TaxID=218851 RepID=A0A2G5CL28_AQUCA|nr:hypothetical protein AQUCO_04900089v1 [Aquilegia coerulea]
MMNESQMNNGKTKDIKRKLAAIGGAVAVVAADITTLIAEFETTIQHVPANSDTKGEEKHDVDDDDISNKTKDSPPVDLSTRKKTCGESHSVFLDEARPMISELIQTVSCLADAFKRNPDQDYADRLFEEVMKTEFFEEDFLVKAFDYLNQYPVLARSFISKRPKMRREWLMRSASNWLGKDYGQPSYFKSPFSYGSSGAAFGASSAQAFGANTQLQTSSQNPFGTSSEGGEIKPPNGFGIGS